ncbi:hypothetical protein [Deinococcus xianganensis]|uniref:Uncharacterized protein n=1 Tax=Deinococcus xianganensis TaxID=1507289 RepID=A0A6I4YGB1_9DEIO|nr:hypothetical protein [Deinococcus xianganensis]MXV19470.1 hypothetical protein [Deinococcus xianganensis]
MFWNRKKFVAAPPYMGSAFDCAVRYCEQHETVTHRTDSEIHVQLDGHTVCIYRNQDDGWLTARAYYDVEHQYSVVKAYQDHADSQFKHLTMLLDVLQNQRIARYSQLMRHQGSPEMLVRNMLSTYDYFFHNRDSKIYPSEELKFICGGRSFENATQALIHYMKHVRRSRVESIEDKYIAFNTAGAHALIGTGELAHEFTIRYAFSDFEKLLHDNQSALTPHYFAAAYRKAPLHTASYCFRNGISELAISGTLTAGTEARPIFTATLAALYQVMLDSTERIKMNPGLLTGRQQLQSEEESILQAKQFQGDRTGGVEFLRDA